MTEGVPSPISESQKLSLPEHGENALIQEVDATSLDLPRLHESLTNYINQGYVLHGSQNNTLTMLEPRIVRDNRGEKKGVFATDNPLIALARGTAGPRIHSWRQQVVFEVDTLDTPFPERGIVYLIPKDQFSAPENYDLSEYFSAYQVTPVSRVSFDTSVVTPLFRSTDELVHEIDEQGFLRPDHVREMDALASLLSIRNIVQQIGIIDYDSKDSSEKGFKQTELFNRLINIGDMILPIVSQVSRFKGQHEFAVEVRDLYEKNTDAVEELMHWDYTYISRAWDKATNIINKLPYK